MHETRGHIEATEASAAFGAPRIPKRPITWSMTASHRIFPSRQLKLSQFVVGARVRAPIWGANLGIHSHFFASSASSTTSCPLLRAT